MRWLDPRLKTFDKFQRLAVQHIVDAKHEKETNSKPSASLQNQNSIFRHILNSDLPESDLSVKRLSREAQVLLGAGTVSSARTMDFLTFYVLNNPEYLSKVQDELAPVMQSYPERMPSWADLEKLPFIQALLKETLRLSYGVMHRLPRVSPDLPIQYGKWTIPPGVSFYQKIGWSDTDYEPKVPIGMSAYMMHSDPLIYEEPFKFKPERWMSNVTPAMNRSLVPFSKGSRNCLGMK